MLLGCLPFSVVIAGLARSDTPPPRAPPIWNGSRTLSRSPPRASSSPPGLGDLFGRKRVVLGDIALTLAGALAGLAAGVFNGTGAIHVLWLAQALCGGRAGANHVLNPRAVTSRAN
jgi:hypothetical protein